MEREDLFKDINHISTLVKCMGAIVQNDIASPPKEELLEWAHGMNELKDRIETAKRNVLKFYLEKVD